MKVLKYVLGALAVIAAGALVFILVNNTGIRWPWQPAATAPGGSVQPGDGSDGAVMTVDGSTVGENEFRYMLLSTMDTYEYYNGATIEWGGELDGEPAADYFRNQAVENILVFRAVELMAADYGVPFDDSDKEQVASYIQSEIENAGGEEQFESSLASNGLNRELYEYLLTVSQLYNKLFDSLYAEGGARYLSDDSVKATFQSTYYHANHILFSFTNDDGTDLSQEEKDAQYKLAEEVLAKAKGGEDFQTLVGQYGQDPGLSTDSEEGTATVGYYFTEGQMVNEFYDAVKELPENGISDVVESSYGYHIIQRLPLEDSYLEANLDTIRSECEYADFDDQLAQYKDKMDIQYLDLYQQIDVEGLYNSYMATED